MSRKAIYLLLYALIAVPSAQAATINAASCNASDVQAALNSVTALTTVVTIPAGTCHWTSQVSFTVPSGNTSLSILGAGNLSTLGGGDSTVIVDDFASGNTLFDIGTAGASSFFRLAGMTFLGGNDGGVANTKWSGLLAISGNSQNVRVDHIHFDLRTYTVSQNASTLVFNGAVFGVTDHSLFDGGFANETRTTQGTLYGDVTNSGHGAWANPTFLGSSSFMFYEDNTFNVTVANDCSRGGKFVMRHNTFNASSVQTHPTGGGGADARGCRAWEIYNNTFTASNASPIFNAYFLSSGTGMIWGNTSPSGYEHFMTMHSMRRDNTTYPEASTPAGWGYCGTSFSGTGSAWDQNTNPATGYACIDQPGRGKGDLITGVAPNNVNARTGNISWLNQALEPVYVWGNNYAGAPGYANLLVNNYNAEVLGQDRDYYVDAASFNGTSGVGSGLLSARPATCTTGVAFWATDTNTLYQCSASNSWTAYYTPYTYPHPLTRPAVTVASCSQSIVQAAIDAAQSGDTIIVPGGNCTWASQITIPNTKGITLDGGGASINGGITLTPNSTTGSRITNFTFTKNGDNTSQNQSLGISGAGLTAARWRVDHSTFTGTGSGVINMNESPGLFDHNSLTGGGAADEQIHLVGWGATDNTGWTTPMPSVGSLANGTDEAIYFEDNTLSASSFSNSNPSWMESYYGARYVFRYNTLNYFKLDAHGNNQSVGTRWWEFYHNIYNATSAGNAGGFSPSLRAGSGIIFGNTTSGTMNPMPSIGMCDETSGATYPAVDQIGRGTNQTSAPAYVWNSAQGVSINACEGMAANDPAAVAFNRDVYTDVNSANCTAGGACTSGVGTGTTLPTTCTTGVGFWKTDAGGNWDTTNGTANDGALYACTAANTWTLYYTPYVYPHPLSSGQAPPPPSNNPPPSGGNPPPGNNPPPPVTVLTLDVPAVLPLNATLTATVPPAWTVSRFDWTFTSALLSSSPAATGRGSMDSPPAPAGNDGIGRAAPGGSLSTSAASASLSSLSLLPGPYTITVSAYDATGALLGTASATVTLVQADLSAVQVYPNPWRSDRHSGGITFNGLPADTEVRIFTVSGHLVRDYTHVSGSKVWDRTNDSGDRVASGVYVYLITTPDGSKKRGKVAVIK